MRLTAEEHPESIRRYAHVKPARGAARVCRVKCPGTERRCTLETEHRGPHVAHGRFRRVVAVWDAGPGAAVPAVRASARAPAAEPERTRRPRKHTPIGLPTGSPVGLLRSLLARLGRALGSVEEIAFLVFFLAFVGFAVHWLVLLLG